MRTDHIKVENEEGEVTNFLPSREWLYHDAEHIASEVAQIDLDNAGGELSDPESWAELTPFT